MKRLLIQLQKKGTGNREQGTGNREQIRNTHLHQFKAQSKKGCFSHVFKHEFFLLESCPFPVPFEQLPITNYQLLILPLSLFR